MKASLRCPQCMRSGCTSVASRITCCLEVTTTKLHLPLNDSRTSRAPSSGESSSRKYFVEKNSWTWCVHHQIMHHQTTPLPVGRNVLPFRQLARWFLPTHRRTDSYESRSWLVQCHMYRYATELRPAGKLPVPRRYRRQLSAD